MAITLYDAVPSSNSDRTKIALHEKGLGYDRVTLDLAKKDQKRAEFFKINPYGKIPVINDGGKILFESCIINEYLDEKYPNPPLMPKDPYLRGRGRVLVDYGLNYIHEPYWALRGKCSRKNRSVMPLLSRKNTMGFVDCFSILKKRWATNRLLCARCTGPVLT